MKKPQHILNAALDFSKKMLEARIVNRTKPKVNVKKEDRDCKIIELVGLRLTIKKMKKVMAQKRKLMHEKQN